MSSGLAKISAERNQKAVQELATKPGNGGQASVDSLGQNAKDLQEISEIALWMFHIAHFCADCKTRNPRWASHNLGIFICVNCASIHRKIGTHITKVKSLTLDTWTKEQVENMRQNGNIKSNQHYNRDEVRNPPPTNMVDSERDSELEKFIRDKYEYKRFVSRSAIVAQHLGPSRSASSNKPGAMPSGQQRSATAPVVPAPQTSSQLPSFFHPPQPPAGSMRAPSSTTSNPFPTRVVSQPQPPSSFTPQASSAAYTPRPSWPSQPQPHPQSQPQQHARNTPSGGVWDDLVALQDPSRSSTLPLQYQSTMPMPASINSLAPTNPFPTGGSSPSGYGAPLGTSPGGGMKSGMSPMQMGSSPFQMQPQPTGFAPQSTYSPTAMPGGNPFAYMSAQSPPPQQPIQRSFTTPIPGPFASQQQQTGFQPQQTGFAPQQTSFTPAPQQQPFLSQPHANSNPFFNGGTGQGLMAQPQMPFHPTPSPQPFAMGTSFQQQPQQPQQMFAAQAQPMQTQATNPFTNWMQQPSGPTQGGFAGQAGPGQWGTMS